MTRGGSVRRGSRLGRVCIAVTLASAGALLVGCGSDQADQPSPSTDEDLCARYDQLVEQVRSLEDIHLDPATLDDLQTKADDVQQQLTALKDAADGQLESAISKLQAAVDDLASAAADAGQQALAATKPVIGQALDDIAEAWATLQLAADAKCGEG